MTIVCPACHAEHRVSVVQHSYRELPCKRCGRPIPIAVNSPSPVLEALADFEETGPTKLPPAPPRPAVPLVPHPSILAAIASSSPFATAHAPPADEPAPTTSPPPPPPAAPSPGDVDTITCPTCGAYYARSLAVCPLCEAPHDRPLPAEPRCPVCAGAIALADRHCRHCGSVLGQAKPGGGSLRWLAFAAAIALVAAIGFWAARFLIER